MELLKVKDVMEMLNISRQTVYTYIKQGLPSIKMGKLRRFDKKEVEEWVNGLKKRD